MKILIPAYKPDNRLIILIDKLKGVCDYKVIIVNDGSGNEYEELFMLAGEMGCTVLTHEVNKGKGQALKTGFNYIRTIGEEEGVVCADCDGQHLPEDIMKIAAALNKHRNSIILGTRRFSGRVPFRSRFGNSITRAVFSFASGSKVYDTQTGLRGYSYDMLKWLCEIPGERFEYEMNMLLEAVPSGYGFHEVEINTVYLEENKSSHFHPLKDSLRIYMPIIKFSMSSVISALLDFILLIIIQTITSSLLLSVVAARIFSATLNYTLNRIFVFSRFKRSSIKKSLPKYFLLALFIMIANYEVIYAYHEIIGLSLLLAKIFTEVTIFLLSFWSQRKFVFNT